MHYRQAVFWFIPGNSSQQKVMLWCVPKELHRWFLEIRLSTSGPEKEKPILDMWISHRSSFSVTLILMRRPAEMGRLTKQSLGISYNRQGQRVLTDRPRLVPDEGSPRVDFFVWYQRSTHGNENKGDKATMEDMNMEMMPCRRRSTSWINPLGKAVVTESRLQPSFQQAPQNSRVFGSSTAAKYFTAIARKVFMWTQS